MATDAEVRDKMLERVRRRIQEIRDELEQVRSQLRLARLEDDAEASLTAEQRTILADAGFTDQKSVDELTGRRDALQAEAAALQAFHDAVRTVA